MLQTGFTPPSSSWDLVLHSSIETKVVLAVILVFSLLSWFVIGLKLYQFRKVRGQANRFFNVLERTTRLKDAYHQVMKLPPSPYTRLFREGLSFFSDLRPGTLRDDGPAVSGTLTTTQLEALKMVLGKEVAAERDLMARFISWLATIGSVGPLLGLLGTVLGVMDAFIGIAAKGSGNIGAVAPGVAEALITTVGGLATAIPAIMAYNLLANRLGVFAGELEGFANEMVGTMAREGML